MAKVLIQNLLAESDLDYASCTRERDKSEICRNTAFRYLIESDPVYADKAMKYLLIADRETADGYEETYSNIIWDAENLTSFAGNLPENMDGAVSYTYEAGVLQLSLEDDSYLHLDVIWALENNSVDEQENPEATTSLWNHPDPFNPETTISYSLNTESKEDTELLIYNINGQTIKKYSIFYLPSSIMEGSYSATWNGLDQQDKPVPSGIYFCKLSAGNKTLTSKMLLM